MPLTASAAQGPAQADDSVPTVMAANDVECRGLASSWSTPEGTRKDGRVCHQDCSLLPLSRLWRGGARLLVFSEAAGGHYAGVRRVLP